VSETQYYVACLWNRKLSASSNSGRNSSKRKEGISMLDQNKTAIETVQISLNSENKATLWLNGQTVNSLTLSALMRSFRSRLI
jgi:hypothetical protein